MQINASFMTLGSPQEVFHAETQEGNLFFYTISWLMGT